MQKVNLRGLRRWWKLSTSNCQQFSGDHATKNEQVKSILADVDLQVREVSERAWKHILETVIYHCDPEDREPVQSEFDREVDSHYYSMREKFEKISELLKEWKCVEYSTTVARSKHHKKL